MSNKICNHEFEPRYDEVSNRELLDSLVNPYRLFLGKRIKGTLLDQKDNLKLKKYVGDICKYCGKFVGRK